MNPENLRIHLDDLKVELERDQQRIMSNYINEDMFSVMVVVGNGIGNLSSNLDKAVCISIHDNALGKSMNATVFTTAIDEL